MEVTYYGHSCFLVKTGKHELLFDPFITPNELAKEIDVDRIQPDYVLLSHGHQDHMADAEQILKQSGATLIGQFELTSWFEKKGVKKTHPLNTGGQWEFDFGTVRLTPAVHSSSFPDGSYAGTASGFLVNTGGNTFYYAGDTDLFSDMQLIGERFQPQFAFLPIGDNFTMDVEAALVAARYVGVTQVVGMHYDTFPYIKIDKAAVLARAREEGIEMLLPAIGETITL